MFRSASQRQSELAEHRITVLADAIHSDQDWFGGTPDSIDARLAKIDQAVSYCRDTVARLGSTRAGYLATSTIPSLEHARRELSDARVSMLNGFSDRQGGVQTPAGRRTARTAGLEDWFADQVFGPSDDDEPQHQQHHPDNIISDYHNFLDAYHGGNHSEDALDDFVANGPTENTSDEEFGVLSDHARGLESLDNPGANDPRIMGAGRRTARLPGDPHPMDEGAPNFADYRGKCTECGSDNIDAAYYQGSGEYDCYDCGATFNPKVRRLRSNRRFLADDQGDIGVGPEDVMGAGGKPVGGDNGPLQMPAPAVGAPRGVPRGKPRGNAPAAPRPAPTSPRGAREPGWGGHNAPGGGNAPGAPQPGSVPGAGGSGGGLNRAPGFDANPTVPTYGQPLPGNPQRGVPPGQVVPPPVGAPPAPGGARPGWQESAPNPTGTPTGKAGRPSNQPPPGIPPGTTFGPMGGPGGPKPTVGDPVGIIRFPPGSGMGAPPRAPSAPKPTGTPTGKAVPTPQAPAGSAPHVGPGAGTPAPAAPTGGGSSGPYGGNMQWISKKQRHALLQGCREFLAADATSSGGYGSVPMTPGTADQVVGQGGGEGYEAPGPENGPMTPPATALPDPFPSGTAPRSDVKPAPGGTGIAASRQGMVLQDFEDELMY